MANGSELTVALRLQADVAQAVKRLGDVAIALDGDTKSADALAEAVRAVAASFSGVKFDVSDDALKQAEERVNRLRASEAASTIGIRLDKDILADIKAQEQAFEKLKASGVASADEISRAEATLKTRVAALNAELGQQPHQMAAGAISAGQMKFAMQSLHYQITDLVTGLASGQRPLTVLIQQGGQIADSFGGVGNTFKLVTGLLTPLRVGAIGAAAGVGALALAYLEAEKESTAFNLATQVTGNFAGATRGKIEELANAANQASGVSVAAARQIATGLVQSGRLGIETIGNLTKSVEAYAGVTGQSTDQAATALATLFEKPAEGAAKLNEQFHFLSFEQLKYIKTLVEQGQKEEAQLEVSRRLSDHLGGAMVANLGLLERAWDRVGRNIDWVKEKMVDIGRQNPIEAQIAAQEKLVQRLQEAKPNSYITPAEHAQKLASETSYLALLRAQKEGQDDAAAFAAEKAKRQERRAELGKDIDALTQTLRTGVEKFQEEKKKLDEALKLKVIDQAEYDKLLARAQERATPKAAAPKADPVQAAIDAKEQSMIVGLTEASLRLRDAKEGVADADRQATDSLEVWLATDKNAQQASQATVALLRSQAAAADALGKSIRDSRETQAARERAAQGLQGIEADWLAATGRAAEASAVLIEQRYAKLIADLKTAGDAAGLGKVQVVMKFDQAKARLAELQTATDKVFQDQSRQEQSIDAQVTAGLITQIEGQKRLVALHGQTAQTIEGYLPLLEQLKNEPGQVGEAARALIQTLNTQLVLLKSTAQEFQNALRNGLQNGIQQALTGLINGTMNLREAVRALMLSVADSLAQIATKKLAEQATNSLLGILGGTGEAAKPGGDTAGAVAITTAGTTAASAMGTSITTSGGIAGESLFTAITSAGSVAAGEIAAAMVAAAGPGGGVSLAESVARAISGGAIGGGAAAGGETDLLGEFIAAMGWGLSGGGYTGPGGVYEPAGLVHKGEFVTRQAVTHQPGALDFLRAFNVHGMAALPALVAMHGWHGYADGGLVGALASPVMASPSMALGNFTPATPPAPAAAQRDRIKVVNSMDMDYLVRGLDGHAGFERVVLNVIRVNPGAVQQYVAE